METLTQIQFVLALVAASFAQKISPDYDEGIAPVPSEIAETPRVPQPAPPQVPPRQTASDNAPQPAQSLPVPRQAVSTQFSPQKQKRPEERPIDPVRYEFMRANLVSTFYHELAHAMIDTMNLPVLAKEEDAADVFAAIMVMHLFNETEARAIVDGALKGSLIDAADWANSGRSWDYSDEHGHDMQRYYTLACLYYGADPENRAEFAETAELPEDRAEVCQGEYQLAARSWGPIIERFGKNPDDVQISFRHSTRTNVQREAAQIVSAEVARMNAGYHLPKGLRVAVKRCKRSSTYLAYYSPNRRKITLCTNYIDDLYRSALD